MIGMVDSGAPCVSDGATAGSAGGQWEGEPVWDWPHPATSGTLGQNPRHRTRHRHALQGAPSVHLPSLSILPSQRCPSSPPSIPSPPSRTYPSDFLPPPSSSLSLPLLLVLYVAVIWWLFFYVLLCLYANGPFYTCSYLIAVHLCVYYRAPWCQPSWSSRRRMGRCTLSSLNTETTWDKTSSSYRSSLSWTRSESNVLLPYKPIITILSTYYYHII